MTFRQLYYTNCEHGLSGYVGYQFNAVTPGTPADVLRDVEALTGYEAPQSLAYSSDPADLARCPVNLCYAPGQTTIVASVSYVGRDSSRRFGNYFAHAIATTQPDDLAGTLPIELWRAPFWVAEQAPSPDLPGLDGPLTRGPLRREHAGAFVAAHRHADRLAALLSAAATAQAGGDRPVLVVEDAADDIAMWFAAISYLLPPRLVSALSFATYVSRPSRNRLQLLGTLTETNLDLGADAPENFLLFDFTGERFAAVPVHPLAALTSALGVPAAAPLWDWTGVLASGNERSMDDWYPVAAAAAALGQIPLADDHIATAIGWLGSACHLPAAIQSEVAWVLHDQSGYQPSAAEREVLAAVAMRAGDQSLFEQVRCELFEAQMTEVLAGRQVLPIAPPAEAAVKDRTSARCQELLQQAGTASSSLALLDWATRAGLPLNPQILIDRTVQIIAPWLGQDGPDQPIDPEARAQAHGAAARSPEFRGGLVLWLAGVHRTSPAAVLTMMTGLIGELLRDEDLHGHPWMAEMHLICLARRTGERRVDVLARLAGHRGERAVDEPLLRLIWPLGGWSRAEALEILRKVAPTRLDGAGPLTWIYQATQRELRSEDVKLHITLCRQLLASPLRRRFGVGQIDCLRAMVDTVRLAAEAATLEDVAALLEPGPCADTAPMQTLLRTRVTAALARVQATPDGLARLLPSVPGYAVDSYLKRVRAMLTEPGKARVIHLAALALLLQSGLDEQRARQIDELIDYAVRRWRRRDLDDLAKLIGTVSPVLEATFRSEVDEVRTRSAVRAAKRLTSGISAVARSWAAEDDVPQAAGGQDREG